MVPEFENLVIESYKLRLSLFGEAIVQVLLSCTFSKSYINNQLILNQTLITKIYFLLSILIPIWVESFQTKDGWHGKEVGQVQEGSETKVTNCCVFAEIFFIKT